MIPNVIIVWKDKFSDDFNTVNILNSYEGPRIYKKDKVDSRCLDKDGNPPKYFDNGAKALLYINENKGPLNSIQLDVKEAKKLGLI